MTERKVCLYSKEVGRVSIRHVLSYHLLKHGQIGQISKIIEESAMMKQDLKLTMVKSGSSMA
jgi:hypothetical protein